jgi:hypothetical protein
MTRIETAKLPDRTVWVERSLHPAIKVFDVVDGEERCAGSRRSTRRGADLAVSASSV